MCGRWGNGDGIRAFLEKIWSEGHSPPRPERVFPLSPRRQQTGTPAADRTQKRPQQIAPHRSQSAPLKYSLNQTTQARNNAPLSMTKQGTAHPAADRRTGSGYEKIVTKPRTNVCVKVHKKDPFILYVRIVNNTCNYPINILR